MKEKEMKKLGMQTKFVFAAPKWWVSALLIGVFSLFMNGLFGFLILAVPAYASLILVLVLSRLLKTRYWVKTELFLSLFYIIMAEAIYVLFIFLFYIGIIDQHSLMKSLFISLALPLWLRHTYLSSIITTEQKKSIFLSITYPVSSIGIFYLIESPVSSQPVMAGTFTPYIGFYILLLFTSLLFSYLFLKAMDAPLKRVLGTGGLEFTRLTVDHYKERSEEGGKKMEEVFSSLGEYSYIDIFSIAFWREKLYGLMGVHTAHMGPFGELAGSDMPRKLSKITGCENFISPHGASTHEMNPVGLEEVKKIGEALKPDGSEKKVMVSKSVKIGGRIKVMAQRFGDWLLISETSSPGGTEDIDPSVAKVLDEKIRNMGYEGLIFIDAHNCSSHSADETFVFSEKYRHLERTVLEAGKKLKKAPLYNVEVGTGSFSELGIEAGIGPMGIKSLVIGAEGQNTAYIVIDGNNMVRGLRERIVTRAERYVDNAEVMTTDNHYVNRVYGGSNPVGSSGMHERIVEGCISSLKEGLENLKTTEIRVKRAVRKIKTFGHGTPVKMVTVSESVSAMGKTLAFLNLLSLILLDALLAMLI